MSNRMADLKQQLDVLDYFGPIAVWISFFSMIFIISVTCILWCCVSETDDKTVYLKQPYVNYVLLLIK
ncbi:unnamed protein product [Gongylonema pulchrum]|uniref:Uncharacterized protein n=1 Tax=Gongylonema pulchrum TaxID=637853 RepID=A0A183E264_9BILA|nr:unnamed protein product [Gongylonema pulchrum]